MKVLLVVNELASSVTARRRVIIQKMLSADHQVEVGLTERRGHATELAADAARRGIEAVVVLGGDGTLNEVANGLVGTTCAVAALPGGSTNVFARTLGLSDDPIEAALSNLEAMAEQRIRRVGVGSVNSRYFLFHTGVGWDALVVRQVEKRADVKRWAGHPLFIWAGLETWIARWDRRRPHFLVRYPDGTTQDQGFFTVVMNSNPYTYVGTVPFNLTTDAGPDRGLVSVSVTKMSSGPFLRLMAQSLRSPDAPSRSRIIDYRADLEELVIEGYGPLPFQVDGDDLGDSERLEFRHHPAALDLVMPDSAPPEWANLPEVGTPSL